MLVELLFASLVNAVNFMVVKLPGNEISGSVITGNYQEITSVMGITGNLGGSRGAGPGQPPRTQISISNGTGA